MHQAAMMRLAPSHFPVRDDRKVGRIIEIPITCACTCLQSHVRRSSACRGQEIGKQTARYAAAADSSSMTSRVLIGANTNRCVFQAHLGPTDVGSIGMFGGGS